MRAFVAVPVGEAVRGEIVRVQEILHRADADVKWVEECNLHLTLKFLGQIAEPVAESLADLIRLEAPRWPPLSLDYAGMGRFPERGAPRVLWAGCTGDVVKLAGLAEAVEQIAEQVGVPRERRPFAAHLTIGRVRSNRNVKRLQSALEHQATVPLGKDTATGFSLIRSTLTPQGAIYDTIATFPLGGM